MMTLSPRLIALACAAPLALTMPAFADTTGEAIDKCVVAMQTASGDTYAEASFKFKRIRGASTKRLEFEMAAGELREPVTCRFRRGSVTEIEWPETVLAALVPAAEETPNNS